MWTTDVKYFIGGLAVFLLNLVANDMELILIILQKFYFQRQDSKRLCTLPKLF